MSKRKNRDPWGSSPAAPPGSANDMYRALYQRKNVGKNDLYFYMVNTVRSKTNFKIFPFLIAGIQKNTHTYLGFSVFKCILIAFTFFPRRTLKFLQVECNPTNKTRELPCMPGKGLLKCAISSSNIS